METYNYETELAEFAVQLEIDRVWSKGIEVAGLDPTVWRRDRFGSRIKRDEYGNRANPYGWEMDHVYPKALGGSDSLSNKQPLQFQNNIAKADRTPDELREARTKFMALARRRRPSTDTSARST